MSGDIGDVTPENAFDIVTPTPTARHGGRISGLVRSSRSLRKKSKHTQSHLSVGNPKKRRRSALDDDNVSTSKNDIFCDDYRFRSVSGSIRRSAKRRRTFSMSSQRSIKSVQRTPWRSELTNQQLSALYHQCLKLKVENKINRKNSWDLNLIDHIGAIIRRFDKSNHNINNNNNNEFLNDLTNLSIKSSLNFDGKDKNKNKNKSKDRKTKKKKQKNKLKMKKNKRNRTKTGRIECENDSDDSDDETEQKSGSDSENANISSDGNGNGNGNRNSSSSNESDKENMNGQRKRREKKEIVMDKRLKNGVNFTKASAAIDVAARIYSCRVDSIHDETYRVLGRIGHEARMHSERDKNENDSDIDGTSNLLKWSKDAVEQDDKNEKSKEFDLEKYVLKHKRESKHLFRTNDQLQFKSSEQLMSVSPLFHKMSTLFDMQGAKGLLLHNLQCSVDHPYLMLDGDSSYLGQCLTSQCIHERRSQVECFSVYYSFLIVIILFDHLTCD